MLIARENKREKRGPNGFASGPTSNQSPQIEEKTQWKFGLTTINSIMFVLSVFPPLPILSKLPHS